MTDDYWVNRVLPRLVSVSRSSRSWSRIPERDGSFFDRHPGDASFETPETANARSHALPKVAASHRVSCGPVASSSRHTVCAVCGIHTEVFGFRVDGGRGAARENSIVLGKPAPGDYADVQVRMHLHEVRDPPRERERERGRSDGQTAGNNHGRTITRCRVFLGLLAPARGVAERSVSSAAALRPRHSNVPAAARARRAKSAAEGDIYTRRVERDCTFDPIERSSATLLAGL